MQFQITLKCLDRQTILPINYQYELSAWIYKVIQNADAEYATFLHERGFMSGRKNFKLFCFSQLRFLKFEVQQDRIHVLSDRVFLTITFYVDRTAEEFIRGLFSEQVFRLGDTKSQARLTVETIEMSIPAVSDNLVRVRMLSPLVVARRRGNNEPDEYLHPDDADFAKILWINLLDKYRSATNQEPLDKWDSKNFIFRLTGTPPKSKLIHIKAGTAAATKVRGFTFDAMVQLPKELLELGLLAGFGRHNAEGFGCAMLV